MNESDAARTMAATYSACAPAYVRLWGPVLLPFGRQLLSRLPLASASRVLDVGTGTGTLLDDLTASAPDATVYGMDFAEGMLRVARERHGSALATADVQALPVADDSIDVAASAFVLFNVPDLGRALSEVRRVLRPGGAFGMTTWGDEPDDAALEIFVEELDAHGAGKDPVAGSDSREQMNTPSKLAGLLETAGFERVETWTDRVAHVWNVEDYVEFLSNARPRRRLDTLAPDMRQRCLARATERMSRLTQAELTERSEVVFGVGTKPG